MQLKLRAKAGGRLEVFDEQGHLVQNVVRIELFCDESHPIPQARITLRPEVVVDAKAEERTAPPATKEFPGGTLVMADRTTDPQEG